MTHTTKKHSNILYKKGNILKYIDTFLNSETRQGFDILIPQCISPNIGTVSKLTQQLYCIFPELKINTEIFVSNNKNYGHTQFIQTPNKHNKNLNRLIFANMVCVKSNNAKRKINYVLLARCMSEISQYIKGEIKNQDNDRIYIMGSKFGTGFFGGNWFFIEQLINDSWDGFTTTIYNYDGNN